MEHPTALQALLSGQIAAHFASPPFQQHEADKGAHTVLESYDVFGEHTGSSLVLRNSFAHANQDVVKALRKSLSESTRMLNDNPDRAAQLLAKEFGGEYTAQQVRTEIQSADLRFTTTPQGFLKLATFMKSIGLIERLPRKPDQWFYQSSLTHGTQQ